MLVYYIPYGPKELSQIFNIDFSNIEKYYLEIKDNTLSIIATTTIAELNGVCCEDKFRIRFLNYCGAIDGVNAKIHLHEHESKSESIQKSTSFPLVKTIHSLNRFNVKAGDIFTLAITDYNEEDMTWLDELIDSPFALMEWSGIQGQDDGFIPIILLDSKKQNKKLEDRYSYEIILQVKLSHEKFIIRN